MRTLSVCLSGAVLAVSFLALKADLFEDTTFGRKSRIGEITILMSITTMTAASCWFMWIAFTPPKTIWWVGLAIGVGLFCLLIYMMGGDTHYASLASVTVILCATLALVTVPILKLIDDNPYRVNRGEVIAQYFTPEHTVMVCSKICSPMFVPDNWAIQLRNCTDYDQCRTGWLHFGSNVFERYPEGSQYPGG